MQIKGLHHVSALTAHAAENYGFYTNVMGLRLIKKTVNQDDVSVYHLFYGDEKGNPGTELTFFEIPMAGQTREGVNSISATSLRVRSDAALTYWQQRFDEFEVPHGEITERGGRATLSFTDFEGQRLILVSDEHNTGVAGGKPWDQSPVPAEYGIVGLGGSGSEVHVEERNDLAQERPGRGSVHHVAFRVDNEEELKQWVERVHNFRFPNSGFVDRFYFRSLYFREPNGILFELATDGPGFDTDEELAHLGESLALPPFLEGRRAEIESKLKPLDTMIR
ncbi:hypothetical protein G195_001860 [Phytophthora kernoviae 00238/432]|uniref:VOC domain-containing protein n=1 Tax=Phytophthora kernoviae 00238/432 TaxID=1284355 RepID=A0A8J4SM89_9STRA|nr:hypothetical protein G195_001860 [Phytophthora kernoviae 00238/432]